MHVVGDMNLLLVQQGIELVDCPGVEAADSQKYYCTWQSLQVIFFLAGFLPLNTAFM